MMFSIWRISHLILATTASLFLLVVSITGGILALEPISNKMHSYHIDHSDELTLAETLTHLNERYDDILSISKDRNGFVSVSVILDGKTQQFYVDPFTGNKLGSMIEKAPIFQFCTSLHRSLFLKTTGRFLIGFTALLLVLIVVSGIILIAKRQGGFRYFFAPVVRDNTSQFNHVVYSRITLLPLIVLSLTGLYLSLLRFELIPEKKVVHNIDYDTLTEQPTQPIQNFDFLQQTTLAELKELEYPFSSFAEDYYTIRLTDREVLLNQFNGAIIDAKEYHIMSTISSWAKILHTGEGSILWSMILGVGSLTLPFLIFSGFAIYFKRPKVRSKNTYSPNECSHIILVGTEGGTTFQYAQAFQQQLVQAGIKCYLGAMNEYQMFKRLEHLVVFTATYGQGEAPVSANKFMELIKKHPQNQSFTFSVVGFGSSSYPNYCQFAYETFDALNSLPNAHDQGEVYTVNNQSFEALSKWVNQWAQRSGLTFQFVKPHITIPQKSTTNFEVLSRIDFEKESTFLLTLKNIKQSGIESGDLLSIVPANEQRERLYSIGNLGDSALVITVKKQPNGICSNMLGQLQIGQLLPATVVKNRHFHLPNHAKEAVLIATGTGIGPFLGMMATNTSMRKLHLYWGGRMPESLQPYQNYINKALQSKRLHTFNPAFSRLQAEKIYVQHLIKSDGQKIASILNSGGCVMICGSIDMQKGVMNELRNICNTYLTKDLSYYQNRNQVKMDCY